MSHPTTIQQAFENALERDGPDHAFVEYSGQWHTLGELNRKSDMLARGLRTLGIHPGSCVSSILDNCVEQTWLLLANAKLGAIHVPVNTAYKGDFLRHQFADTNAPVIVCESEYLQRVLAVKEGLPDVKAILVRGATLSEIEPFQGASLRVLRLEDVLQEDGEPLAHRANPGDLAMLIYTAGTTGPSKGCMLSHNYCCENALTIAKAFAMTSQDVVWTPLPGFHNNQIPTLIAGLILGYKVVVYSRFSVSNFWPEMERNQVTAATLLGSMVALIAQAPENEAAARYRGKMRVIGGVPFPAALQQVWRDRFGVRQIFCGLFGLTECSPITVAYVDDVQPIGCAGRRNPNFEVRLVNEQNQEVPDGQAGEITIRPKFPNVMFEGYWRREEQTAALWRDGWFHTGDIGRFDEQGFFFFVDRKKDYLRRRGENVSSQEVEAIFRQHPDLSDFAVHAVPSDVTEDDIKLTAILKTGTQLTERELLEWAVERLPYFAVPRYIEFRQDLPRNPVGRVLKYQLRDEGVTATTWDMEAAGIRLSKR